MDSARPEYVPDPSLTTEEMERLQREIATVARFSDDPPIDPASPGVVAGVDQAFLDDWAVSAIVALEDGEVIERASAVSPLSLSYVPGLLSFREGGPIIDAARELDCEPDLLLFDGSGRIHYRQAGLATHMGVVLDTPSVGVAKGLLCGTPRRSTEELPEGTRVPIDSDGDVERVGNTEGPQVDDPIGHAVQTRQYDSSNRHVNPVYVSPGHRVGAASAADHAEAQCVGYKLPEPIRLADAHADEVKRATG
ncbi:MAG: endonuclease V [Halobacteriales archaeon]